MYEEVEASTSTSSYKSSATTTTTTTSIFLRKKGRRHPLILHGGSTSNFIKIKYPQSTVVYNVTDSTDSDSIYSNS